MAGTASIQRAERFENLVNMDRRFQAFGRPQRRAGCDRGSIRSPGSEDGALFRQTEAWIGNDITGMSEHRARVKQGVEIKNIVARGRRPHGLPPIQGRVDRVPRGTLPRGGDRSKSRGVGQAALASIWFTLTAGTPPVGMRRGFMA